MCKFFSHICTSSWKEYLLLKRDKACLLVLFLMPAVLVIIVTLVQENVMELSGEKPTEILFYDQDKDLVATKVRDALLQSDRVNLVEVDPQRLKKKDLVAKVNSGEYQVGIVIPAGTTQKLTEASFILFSGEEREEGRTAESLPLYFDPSVLPGYRTGIVAILQITLFRVEMELKIAAFEKMVQTKIPAMKIAAVSTSGDLKKNFMEEKLVKISMVQTSSKEKQPPSAVQHNIPSWSLFGLFFTCIPLAGSLLTERKSGIWVRLMGMPVSPAALLSGKIVAYVGVCLCQIALIVLIGIYVFPLLDLPAFTIGGDFFLLFLTSLCCSLAACGYGVFLGTVCSSLEQASMLGSISIVIAAAIGGTLVPIYAMPVVMQKISAISPLNWGVSSYQDILLRSLSLQQITPNLLKLIFFFLFLLVISWQITKTKK